jgi:small subunit ribosomal protein S21
MSVRMRVHDREPIGSALRRFKKLIERSGMKKEIRAHEYYEKPCEIRSRKERTRIKTIQKAASGKPVKPPRIQG